MFEVETDNAGMGRTPTDHYTLQRKAVSKRGRSSLGKYHGTSMAMQSTRSRAKHRCFGEFCRKLTTRSSGHSAHAAPSPTRARPGILDVDRPAESGERAASVSATFVPRALWSRLTLGRHRLRPIALVRTAALAVGSATPRAVEDATGTALPFTARGSWMAAATGRRRWCATSRDGVAPLPFSCPERCLGCVGGVAGPRSNWCW